MAALLDDLKVQGQLEETLVVVTGEFGRTPRIGSSTGNANSRDGRDHWARVFSAVFAGAGVRGGQTIGQSDRMGAYPASRPYTPGDLAATIYRRSACCRITRCTTGWDARFACVTAKKFRRFIMGS